MCNLRHMKNSPGLCSNVHYPLLDHYSWLDHKCGSPTSQIASKKSGLSLASSVSSQPMAASCQSTDRQGCSLATPDTLGNSWIKKQKYKKSPAIPAIGWRFNPGNGEFWQDHPFSRVVNSVSKTHWPTLVDRMFVSPGFRLVPC